MPADEGERKAIVWCMIKRRRRFCAADERTRERETIINSSSVGRIGNSERWSEYLKIDRENEGHRSRHMTTERHGSP